MARERFVEGYLAALLAQGLIDSARAHERRVLAPFGRERAALLKAVLKEMIEQHQMPAEG